MDELRKVWPEDGIGHFRDMADVFEDETAPEGCITDVYGLMRCTGRLCFVQWLPGCQVFTDDLLRASDPEEYRRVNGAWDAWAHRHPSPNKVPLIVFDIGPAATEEVEGELLQKLGLSPEQARESCARLKSPSARTR